MDKKIIQKAGKYFTENEKHSIIQEMLSNQCTKREIWQNTQGKTVRGAWCLAKHKIQSTWHT